MLFVKLNKDNHEETIKKASSFLVQDTGMRTDFGVTLIFIDAPVGRHRLMSTMMNIQ